MRKKIKYIFIAVLFVSFVSVVYTFRTQIRRYLLGIVDRNLLTNSRKDNGSVDKKLTRNIKIVESVSSDKTGRSLIIELHPGSTDNQRIHFGSGYIYDKYKIPSIFIGKYLRLEDIGDSIDKYIYLKSPDSKIQSKFRFLNSLVKSTGTKLYVVDLSDDTLQSYLLNRTNAYSLGIFERNTQSDDVVSITLAKKLDDDKEILLDKDGVPIIRAIYLRRLDISKIAR